VIHQAVQILNQQRSSALDVVVVSFTVWLIGIESACIPPPEEDDSPGFTKHFIQKILTQQCS
jgi:hypothetical protein